MTSRRRWAELLAMEAKKRQQQQQQQQQRSKTKNNQTKQSQISIILSQQERIYPEDILSWSQPVLQFHYNKQTSPSIMLSVNLCISHNE